MENISFSYETKLELCKLENKKTCCEKAEVYALLFFSKFFSTSGKLPIENSAVARRLSEKVVIITGVFPELTVNLKRKGYNFSLLGKGSRKFISSFFEQNNINEISFKNVQKNCCAKSFLRGVFLACGWVSSPEKQYKLELVCQNENIATNLQLFIEEIVGVTFKISKRKENFIIYSKSSGQIEDFLTFIGATNASMDLMQTKMYKEAINNINRKSNFETANMDKTYSASAKQIAAIVKLVDTQQFEELSDDLKTVANYRLDHPDMSLKEMSEKLNLSRSAVDHRLRKLMKICEKLG